MASRSLRRKQQTRLTFTPVASSSPAPKSSFAPAYVGYVGASFRSRSPGFKVEEDIKPSFEDDLDDEASSDMMPTPRRTQPSSRTNKVQRGSSASSASDDQLLTSGSKKRKRAGPSMWRDQAHDKARQPRISSSLSRRVPSDRDDTELLPGTSPQLSRLSNRKRPVSSESEEDLEDDDGSPPALGSGSRRSRAAPRLKSLSPIDELTPSSSRTTRSARKMHPKQPIVIESSEEDGSPTKNNRDLAALQAMADEDESEDSAPRSRKSAAKHKKRTPGNSKFSEYAATRDTTASPPLSTRRSRLANRPLKSSTPKAPRTADLEDDDLAEDLEFLQRSSPPATSSLGKRKKNARESALEQLKKRRRGEITILSDEPDDGEVEEVTSDDDLNEVNGDAGSATGNDDSDPDEAEERRGAIYSEIGGYGGHIKEKRSRRSPDPDGEDVDDFIVSDEDLEDNGDDSLIGVPDTSAQIPIELTRYAKMKAKDLFRYIVEWMVQKRLNPAFQFDDELYTLAFKKVEDELNGLVGSKFRSSIWTPDFLYALNGRPDLAVTDLCGEVERDHCEACGRKTHPASYQMQFFGKPYYIETLEVVDQRGDHSPDSDSSSDASSSSESPTSSPSNKEVVDAKGRVLPSATHKFNVGRNCKHNASTAHALHHWRTHLYEHIKEHLHMIGTDSAEAIIRRDQMSTRKRMDQANRIVDAMVEEGIVRRIWRDFRGEIDAARAVRQ